jgi:hypothetical protein
MLPGQCQGELEIGHRVAPALRRGLAAPDRLRIEIVQIEKGRLAGHGLRVGRPGDHVDRHGQPGDRLAFAKDAKIADDQHRRLRGDLGD